MNRLPISPCNTITMRPRSGSTCSSGTSAVRPLLTVFLTAPGAAHILRIEQPIMAGHYIPLDAPLAEELYVSPDLAAAEGWHREIRRLGKKVGQDDRSSRRSVGLNPSCRFSKQECERNQQSGRVSLDDSPEDGRLGTALGAMNLALPERGEVQSGEQASCGRQPGQDQSLPA